MDVERKYTIGDLIELMARLREPESGCPWDLKQNYKTIAPSTLEEAYEVVDAIEREDFVHLREELGDLLFQVVFYAQLGREDGHFDFDDIAHSITSKLLRRHPHVFPEGTLESRIDPDKDMTDADVKQQWEAIKQAERSEKGQHGLLADVPVALPATARASKLQKRAALAGFDWSGPAPVLGKIREELAELEQAIETGQRRELEPELGDVLFSVINLARHLKVDPDSALRGSNQRFTARFTYIEQALQRQGRTAEQSSLEEMDDLWSEAKQQGL